MIDFANKIKAVSGANNPLLDKNVQPIKGAVYWVFHLSRPMIISNISNCEFNDIFEFVDVRGAALAINTIGLNLAIMFDTEAEAQEYLDERHMVRDIHHYDFNQEELPI